MSFAQDYRVRLLDLALDPTGCSLPSLSSPLFISLDLEIGHNPERITQIGVSTFDAQNIAEYDNLDEAGIAKAIQSECYYLEQRPKRCASGRYPAKDSKFLFAVPQTIARDDVHQTLHEVFTRKMIWATPETLFWLATTLRVTLSSYEDRSISS